MSTRRKIGVSVLVLMWYASALAVGEAQLALLATANAERIWEEQQMENQPAPSSNTSAPAIAANIVSSAGERLAPPPVTLPTHSLSIGERHQRISEFVPDGWRLLTLAEGDLDKDGVTDVAFVLTARNSEGSAAEGSRLRVGADVVSEEHDVFAVALADAQDGVFVLTDLIASLVPSGSAQWAEPPLESLTIDRGVLRITLHLWPAMGSWTSTRRSYVFRFQGGCFQLIGYDATTAHRGDGATTEISANFLTGRASRQANQDPVQWPARRYSAGGWSPNVVWGRWLL